MATDYGIDVSTLPDLDQAFGLISGQTALAESLARRIQTPRGALPFNPDDGVDVTDWLHGTMTDTEVFRLRQAVESEMMKDERVLSVACDAVWDASSASLSLVIRVVPVEGREFSMTANLTDFDFRLIGVN